MSPKYQQQDNPRARRESDAGQTVVGQHVINTESRT